MALAHGMHTQRQVEPIPPGRYWITVLGRANQADFDAWVRDMQGAVTIETTSLDERANPSTEFVIFNVPEGRFPYFNAVQFGFPTTAPPGVNSITDVEQAPPPEPDFSDSLSNLAPKLELGGALLALLAVLMLTRH